MSFLFKKINTSKPNENCAFHRTPPHPTPPHPTPKPICQNPYQHAAMARCKTREIHHGGQTGGVFHVML